MKIKTAIYTATICVAVTALSWLWLSSFSETKVPQIRVNTIKGQTLDFASLTGKPLLVTFWATTCSICLKELPHLISLYNELNNDGFEIIGIAMYYDPPNRVVELSRQKDIPYTIALDIDGSAAKAFGNIEVTPSSFLVDQNGTIIDQQIGKLNVDKLRIEIKQLIKNKVS